MNLKNRFRLIIFSMVALLVSIAVIVTIGILFTKLHIQQAIGMDELVVDLYKLQILSSEYVATPSVRVKQQWRTKYDQIRSKLIKHRSIPDDVKDALNGLQQLFDRLIFLPDTVPGMEVSQKRLRNQIAATLTLESQRIIEWASSLSIQKKDGIVPYLLLIDAVMLAVMLVAVLVVITIMIISTRYILLSIKRLIEGAEEIASGKLGFQVEQAGNDEIAMLATAINQMSIGLMDSYENLYEKTVQLETEITERQMIQEALNIKTVELREEIEERKRTEEALRRSEENLSKAQKLSHIGSYMYDVANDRFEWSDEVFRIIGMPPQQDFTGSTNDYFKSIHPDDRERVVQSIENAIVEKCEEDFIHRIIRSDGEELFIHERFRPIFDEYGLHIKNIGSIQDITERKRTEEALKESEAKYRSMMEAMDDAVHICSGNFRIEYMNTAMIKRIGYDATGESCYKVLHGFDEKCPWCIYDKVMKGQFIKTEVLSPKDNRTYHVSNSPIFHSNGAVSKLTIFRDISEIKKTEERLLQAQKMESIGSLAGGIAHDLNNILFPISGLSEMLIDDIPPDNPAHKSVEQIHKSAKRGSDLVKQILSFSRQSNLQKLPILIQPILKEALKLAQATIPRNIEVKSHIGADCGMVSADPTQMHQILMNLITNAYHAVEGIDGAIHIELKETEFEKDLTTFNGMKPGKYACLSVSDTGTGIEKGLIDKIFDPYFTTKEQGKGTGLGLSVVHGIVKEHGGDIRVYSEVGKGTVFHVYFPLLEAAKDSKPVAIIRTYPTGCERILLVDDEEPIVRMEKMMLEKLGYQITVRTNSLDALDAFKANHDNFDLVISDRGMANMTGEQLSREIISIRPGIPIILCTGFCDKIDENRAKAMGVKGFLMKPVATGDLAEMVRKVLDEAKGPTSD